MRFAGFVCAGALLVLAPRLVLAADPLAGKWQLEGYSASGAAVPKAFTQEGFANLYLSFAKNEVTVLEEGKAKPRARFKFSADDKSQPKKFDIEFLDGPDKGKKLIGAFSYCADEDALKLYLSGGQKRPDPRQGGNNEGMILQLVRPRR